MFRFQQNLSPVQSCHGFNGRLSSRDRIVIFIIYGMNAIELLLVHKNACPSIDSNSSNIYIK